MQVFTTIINGFPGTIAQGLIWGLMAIGVFITYKLLDIADLSVDGSICTGGAVCAVLIVAGVPAWVAVICAFFAGALCGLVTGLFLTVMGIPPILSGILTQLMLWSINLKILGASNLSVSARQYSVLLSSLNPPIAILVLAAFAVAAALLLYWFFGTQIGRGIRATGCNQNMSRAQGINTELNKVIGLMLSNAIVALSGALLTQYQGNADINMGRGAIVIGLAAVIIGNAVLSKFSGNFLVKLFSVFLGGIIYYVVYSVVIALGLDTDLLKMLSAIVVAIFLAVPYWKKKFSKPKLGGAAALAEPTVSDGEKGGSDA